MNMTIGRPSNNYRVEYRLGEAYNNIWVDADYYNFDDQGVCRFFVGSFEVFCATHVYSVTWIRELPPVVTLEPTFPTVAAPPFIPFTISPLDPNTTIVVNQ